MTAGSSCTFLARIYSKFLSSSNNANLLVASNVSSIKYTIYKVVQNFNVTEKNPVNYGTTETPSYAHKDVNVSTTAILETPIVTDAWTVDSVGYNFSHTPSSETNAAFPESGEYEIVYTITPTTGNPIVFSFDVSIN